ncbi:gamma-glutamyl-gamma-aminobutyrate hydrolase family protein [Mycobacterium sp. TJFP1]
MAITMDFDVLQRYHHWRAMLGGLVAAGAAPLTIDCRSPRSDLEHIVGMVDGLILLGGADVSPDLYGGDSLDPLVTPGPRALDDNEMSALHIALRNGLPVLAICRGAQLTNVAMGGTLYADLGRDHSTAVRHRLAEEELDRTAHIVDVAPDSRLAEWMGAAGRIAVNSMHHQGIKDLAPSVRPTAVAEDGLIEAFEILAANLVAVQWHPEILWMNDMYAANLIRGFVRCCAARSALNTACC